MASKNTGTRGCANCGGGSNGNGRSGGGKSKFWWWVIGIGVALVYFSNQPTNGSGSKDYVPPGQHQTTQKKCDPNALFQFGCTP